MLLVFYLLVVEYLIQETFFFLPLQLFETGIVQSTQSLAGINVYSVSEHLFYPDHELHLIVGSLCTGIREMFLFAIIILPFSGISRQRKLKSLAIFLPIILIENLIRLWLLYPLASNYGVGTMNVAHDIIWQYGQIGFLILLLFIWFRFYSRLSRVKEKGGKGNKKKAKKVNLE